MKTKDFQKYVIKANSTLLQTLTKLEDTKSKTILITNDDGILLGTATDGDIRRALVNGAKLESEIDLYMNTSPLVLQPESDIESIKSKMLRLGLFCLPIVDIYGKLIDVYAPDIGSVKLREEAVLIMAGGRGARLKPLTDSLPKPLLKIAGRSLLETLLIRLSSQGFVNIFISVSYLANKIKSAIGNGAHLGLNVVYIDEKFPQGTAGALFSLPKEVRTAPVLVCNADLVSAAQFDEIMDFHKLKNHDLTLVTSWHSYEVPYGVVEIDGSLVQGFSEKPEIKVLISTGINVIGERILCQEIENNILDMPTLINRSISNKFIIGNYTLSEYWLDIGNPEAMNKAIIENQE